MKVFKHIGRSTRLVLAACILALATQAIPVSHGTAHADIVLDRSGAVHGLGNQGGSGQGWDMQGN